MTAAFTTTPAAAPGWQVSFFFLQLISFHFNQLMF
jgi:hypothetical protein